MAKQRGFNQRMITTAVAILFFCFSPALAQEPLSLEKSIALALKNNRLIHLAQKDVALAEAKIKEAKTVFLPQASLSSSYTRFDETPPLATSDQTYEHQLGLSQFLFDGGRAWAVYGQAKANISLSKWQYEQEREELIFQAKKAYFELLIAQKLRELAERISQTNKGAS